jgi:hypothetical protein
MLLLHLRYLQFQKLPLHQKVRQPHLRHFLQHHNHLRKHNHNPLPRLLVLQTNQ